MTLFGGSPLNADVEPDRTVLAACGKIRDVLEEHRQIPAELMPSLESTEAMRFVLRQVEGETIPPPPDHGAIEMLGWLELPLDDAPALVVTGFNEGQRAGLAQFRPVPAEPTSPGAGHRGQRPPLRPRCLRPSVLAASREDLRLIAGRRSAEGDPLLPSRLLFACDDATMARRVMAFFSAAPGLAGGRGRAGKLQPGQEHSLLGGAPAQAAGLRRSRRCGSRSSRTTWPARTGITCGTC